MNRFFNIDIGLDFSIDSDILENNENIKDEIYQEFLSELISDINETPGIEYVDNYDDGYDKEDFFRVPYFFIETQHDKQEFERIISKILSDKANFKYQGEIYDGTSYEERHGFDYGPGETVYNSYDATIDVYVDSNILKIEEVNEDGDPLIEAVSNNELKERAKRHRKKQKGLPALSKIGNAGNVEHNINMFNHMMTPNGGPSNNPISGPMGGDVSAPVACCESLDRPPRYIARKINWLPEEFSITCYDTEQDEEFDKWISNGMNDEDNGRMNARRFIENPDFEIPKQIKNELISTFGLDDFNHKIEESIEDNSLNDDFDMFLRSYL